MSLFGSALFNIKQKLMLGVSTDVRDYLFLDDWQLDKGDQCRNKLIFGMF